MLGLLRAASKGCVGSVPAQPFLHEDQDSQEEPVAPIAPDRFRCSPFACGRKGPTNGNGTEGLPDRYLDGIRSFTVGAGYVPAKDFLLEAFYTFGAR